MTKFIYAHSAPLPTDIKTASIQELRGFEKSLLGLWQQGYASTISQSSLIPLPLLMEGGGSLAPNTIPLVDQICSDQANTYVVYKSVWLSGGEDADKDIQALGLFVRDGALGAPLPPNLLLPRELVPNSEQYSRALVVPNKNVTSDYFASRIKHLFSRMGIIPSLFCLDMPGIDQVVLGGESLGVRVYPLCVTGELQFDAGYAEMVTHIIDFGPPKAANLSNSFRRLGEANGPNGPNGPLKYRRIALPAAANASTNRAPLGSSEPAPAPSPDAQVGGTPISASISAENGELNQPLLPLILAPKQIQPSQDQDQLTGGHEEAPVSSKGNGDIGADAKLQEEDKSWWLGVPDEKIEAICEASRLFSNHVLAPGAPVVFTQGKIGTSLSNRLHLQNNVDRLHFFLIDVSNMIDRAFYVAKNEPNEAGFTFGAIIQFLRMISSFKRSITPDVALHSNVAMIAAADAHGRYFRHDLYPEYKQRKPRERSHEVQRQFIMTLLPYFGIPVYSRPAHEADDCIASLTKVLSEANAGAITVVSPDKDLMVLVDDQKRVSAMPDKEYKLHRERDVLERLGLSEHLTSTKQIADVLAIASDRTDGIPGVKGVGEKSAAQLIGRFGTLEKLLASVDDIVSTEGLEGLRGKERIATLLRDGVESAVLSYKLIELNDSLDFDLGAIMGDLHYLNGEENSSDLDDVAAKLGAFVGLPQIKNDVQPAGLSLRNFITNKDLGVRSSAKMA